MENITQKQIVHTELTGKLLGVYDITTRYSNPIGVAPESVNITCNVVEETARININISCSRDEIWNVAATFNGSKNMGEIMTLIVAIKEEVLNTITETSIVA